MQKNERCGRDHDTVFADETVFAEDTVFAEENLVLKRKVIKIVGIQGMVSRIVRWNPSRGFVRGKTKG